MEGWLPLLALTPCRPHGTVPIRALALRAYPGLLVVAREPFVPAPASATLQWHDPDRLLGFVFHVDLPLSITNNISQVS